MKPCCWVVVIYLSFGLPCESFYRVELRDRAPRAIFDSIPFVSDAANIAGNIAGQVSSGISGAVQGITNNVKDVVSKVSSGVGNAIDTVASGFAQHPNNNTLESGESTTIRTEASTATTVNVANDDQVASVLLEKMKNEKPSLPNNIFDIIASSISNPIGAIQKGINNTVEAVKSGIGNAVEAVKSGVGGALNMGTSGIGNTVDLVKSGVDRAMNTTMSKPKEDERSWFDKIIDFFRGVFAWFFQG